MTLPKQDDLSRQRRLNNGCCPVHGCKLVPGEQLSGTSLSERWVFECPRQDCGFEIVPKLGTKCYVATYPYRLSKRRGT